MHLVFCAGQRSCHGSGQCDCFCIRNGVRGSNGERRELRSSGGRFSVCGGIGLRLCSRNGCRRCLGSVSKVPKQNKMQNVCPVLWQCWEGL